MYINNSNHNNVKLKIKDRVWLSIYVKDYILISANKNKMTLDPDKICTDKRHQIKWINSNKNEVT